MSSFWKSQSLLQNPDWSLLFSLLFLFSPLSLFIVCSLTPKMVPLHPPYLPENDPPVIHPLLSSSFTNRFLFSNLWQPQFFLFPCPSCVSLPFLFFSFLSSTLPTWEDNSPARKMIFLLFNYAAALFPSSLNVDTLSIYIHPGPFFSFFIFFFSNVDWISLNHSLQVSFPKEAISVDKPP